MPDAPGNSRLRRGPAEILSNRLRNGLPAKAASIPILGAGATAPCSTWIWARRHQPAANDLQNWALGYFSGQEMAMSSNFLIGSNANILYTALDTQCQQEPNISVASAIDILVAQLKEGL